MNSHPYAADCERCFGLCCVALPYARSADFAQDKDGGVPCRNLDENYRCGIHPRLRSSGFKGCTVYDCFGAGQRVSQGTYRGVSWRDEPAIAKEMFDVFPIVRQLHEMLAYLHEALSLEEARPLREELRQTMEETEALASLDPQSLLGLDVPARRAVVNERLLRVSELVRGPIRPKLAPRVRSRLERSKDLIGADLKGADLRGANLRGVLLLACDLRGADLSGADLIGADLRDADLRGANLAGALFLTQAQVNSARGDARTRLPDRLGRPKHWTA